MNESAGDADRFDPRRVRFVLVSPQTAGNVGSTARAMKNLGFSRLCLVRPECDPTGPDARKLAVDASDVLERAEIAHDLDAALDGVATVVGTTARTGKHRQPHWPLTDFAGQMARHAAAGELAVVFGREDHGLSDEELDHCTHLIYLPSSAEYSSFNLAQAVLLVAWELRLAGMGRPVVEPTEVLADQASREAMYRHLQEALLAIGFLHDDSVGSIMRRLRRLYGRANLTSREGSLLRGMARQILWAAGRAGLSRPVPDPRHRDDGPEDG
jgi:tRNA/rRNA methyltransferase